MAIKFVPISQFSLAKNKPKPVEVVYKDGRTCRFPSAYEASRLMGVPHPNIVACLKGRHKTAGGYVWRYAEDGK